MLHARISLLLATCLVVAACSSDGPTEPGEDARPSVGDTVIATTAFNGQATVLFQGEESEHRIGVTLRDFDSERAVAGLEIHAVALAEGIFLRTEDPAGRYFTSTQYIPYTSFQPADGKAARLAVYSDGPDVGPAPVAWVAVTGLVIAVYAVGSAIYEYATDPPGFDDVFNDDGTQNTCLTGDLNDVLAAWGAGGVRTISGAVRVLGAPAQLRGVTSINLGFTRLAVYQQFNVEAFTVLVDNYTGLLDSDVTVWCWPRAGNQVIPIIRGEVTRQATQFDIVRVLSQATYPVVPTRDQITTTVGAEWSGTPVFPVDMLVTPISCYPDWVCYNWNTRYTTSANPLRQTFGCWASNPAARSGSMTFRIQLRDRNGVTTPPATFNFRCGNGAASLSLGVPALSAAGGAAGGFVGSPASAPGATE